MTLNPRLDYSPEPVIPLNRAQEKARTEMLALYRSGELKTEAVPCYCGNDGGEEIAARDRYGFPIRTLLCLHCGLLRTSPRMTEGFATRFYREFYRPLYDPAWEHPNLRFEDDIKRGREIAARIPAVVPSILDDVKVVFDVGCASGGVLQAFHEMGKQTAGCDFARRYLDFGRARGRTLIEGGASDLVEGFGGRADLVLFLHVLEHLFDLKRELEAVVDAVRPGGFLLVVVPGLNTVSTSYNGDLLRYLQNAHNYYFTAATLLSVLASVGLDVLSVDEAGFALSRRPQGWEKGGTYPVMVSPRTGMEVLSRLLRMEVALAKAQKSPVSF